MGRITVPRGLAAAAAALALAAAGISGWWSFARGTDDDMLIGEALGIPGVRVRADAPSRFSE